MRRTLFLLTITGLVIAACSTRSRQDDASSPPTILEVDNRASLDMTIFVVETSGLRTRLGSVVAHTTDWLRIPARMMSVGIVPLQFQADPVGRSARPVTQTINVQRGDTVVMILPVGGTTLR